MATSEGRKHFSFQPSEDQEESDEEIFREGIKSAINPNWAQGGLGILTPFFNGHKFIASLTRWHVFGVDFLNKLSACHILKIHTKNRIFWWHLFTIFSKKLISIAVIVSQRKRKILRWNKFRFFASDEKFYFLHFSKNLTNFFRTFSSDFYFLIGSSSTFVVLRRVTIVSSIVSSS